ncbi:TonB-dependent receptor [Algibacter marinivivus]|uniref:TonB-dependent receptor n=1 Tax=Algibacter marinivivus TaxID=2100723 RepID=A0A2U2X715_9FLAO|nr:outer membrane beta-barrel protein [Algibacter marinivivus]PWH83561.1 TonB-dependent receptor [Algibacter marinivivus]
MKHIITTFLFLLIGTQIIQSQISGKIIDVNTNAPLEYATAALYSKLNKELITGVITNEDGTFSIQNIKKGTYYLEASFIGYEVKTVDNIEVTNKNGLVSLGTISLIIGKNQLDAVVVKGEKATVINKIDRQVFNTKAFQNTKGGSATDVIKNLPSISVNGLGEISVRGSSGFVVLLDGKPVQGNASTLLNQLPANALERVEMITAPSAKYDPEGKAGILNIITKKGGGISGNFAQINVSAGLPSIEDYDNKENTQRYGIDGTYNIRREKWNISIGANYQRKDISGRREGEVWTIVDDVFTSFPSDGERSFDEENFSGRFTLDFTPDSNNEFSLGFYAGKREKARTADILYNNEAYPVDDEDNKIFELSYFNENLRIRKGDFVLGSIDYAHTFANKSKLSSSFLYEYTLLGGPTTNRNLDFPNTESLIQDEFNTNDNPLNGFRGQLDYLWKPLSFGTLETGYQFRTLDNRGDFFYGRRTDFNDDFERVDLFSSDIDLIRTIHSTYAQLSGKKDKWEYAAGLRLEILDRELILADKAGTFEETLDYNYEKLFPSASVQYSFSDKTNVKVAYSKRVDRPSAFKLNPFREREHSETLEQGDKNLLPEFIDLVELGITKKFNKGNSIFATAYFRNVENLVNRVNQIYSGPPIDPDDARFDNVVLDRIYSNIGTGRSLGLELGAQLKPTSKWSNFIGFNIYNFEIDGAYNGEKIDSNETQYSINANSTYNFSDTATLQFTLNYLSERQTAQGKDSRFYSPNLSFKKSFLNNQLVATLQWQNIDMGLLDTNEQRITTSRPGEFFTTTNYVYEVDVIMLNLSYSFNKTKSKAKFIDSEFGKREF